MNELKDEDVPQTIRDFVRDDKHIEIYDYIRRGLNGEVYFGKRRKLGDDVVLKFYWSHDKYDEREEAVILMGIKHPNILEVYDLRFLPPNYAYFLTPKVSGGDIQQLIDCKKISSKRALEIVTDILLGLTELHSKHKLVHRDLKPGNILIRLEDNKVIIADLGAVKKIEDANGHVTASKSTYYYLAPEAIENDKYYFQSDIYQVGIIFYQLLGGFFPLDQPKNWLTKRELKQLDSISDSTEKYRKFDELIGNKIIKGSLIDTNTLPNYLDTGFKRVINRATHKDYKKRYKDASHFLKDVHQLLRTCPDYFEENNELIITHGNGKRFRISSNSKIDLTLEKSIKMGSWRKEKSHGGSYQSALNIAKAG